MAATAEHDGRITQRDTVVVVVLFNTLFFHYEFLDAQRGTWSHGQKPRRRYRAVGDQAQQPQQDALGAPSAGFAYSFRTGCQPPPQSQHRRLAYRRTRGAGLVWERLRDKPAPQPTPGAPRPSSRSAAKVQPPWPWSYPPTGYEPRLSGLAPALPSLSEGSLACLVDSGAGADEAHDLVGSMLGRLDHGPRLAAIGSRRRAPFELRTAMSTTAQPGLERRSAGLPDPQQILRPGGPRVRGNDADLAACAEHMRGSGRGTADFICLWGEAASALESWLAAGRCPGAGYAGEVGT